MAQVMEPSAPNKQTPQTTNSPRPVGPTGLAGIRSGVVLRGCECNKRNGLTHDCRCGMKHGHNPVSQGQTQNHPCPPNDGKNAAGDQIYCQQPTAYQHAQGDGTGNMQMQTMHTQNQAHLGNNPQYANYVPNNYQGQGNPNQQVVCDPAILNQQQNPHYTNQIQGGYAQSNLPMQNTDANAYNNPHVHNHHANTIAGMPNTTPLLNQNNEIRPCEHMMTTGQTNVCPPNMVQNNQAANMQLQHTCGAHPNSMVCAQNAQNHLHNVGEISEQVPNSVMQLANQQYAQGNYNIANAMKTMAEQPFPAQNQSTPPNCPHQHNQLPNQNAYLANHNTMPGQMYQQNTAAQEQVNAAHQNAQMNSANQSQIHNMHTGYENQYTPCEHHHPQGTMPQVSTGANNTQAMNYAQNTMAQFPNNQYYQNQPGMQGNAGYLNASPNQQQITNSAGFQNYQGQHQQINAVSNNMQLQQQTNAVANNMQQGHFGMAHPGYSNTIAPAV